MAEIGAHCSLAAYADCGLAALGLQANWQVMGVSQTRTGCERRDDELKQSERSLRR
jgi:hypothetical protein